MHELRSPRDAGAERRRWDARYSAASGMNPPTELLARWIDRLAPGRALDLACGSGRNALLLAEHGWRVVGVDIAPQALHLARTEARRRSLALDLVALDLHGWPLPPARFDLVCMVRFLDRALCPAIAGAVRPGGVLIYQTFTAAQRELLGGPREDAFLLQAGELKTLFGAFEQLHYWEGVRDEHGQARALAELVARKPA